MNFNDEHINSWIKSAKNVKFSNSNNILEAELKTINGDWVYNKIKIHDLLLNKELCNNNGKFKYKLSREDDDIIMNKLFPIYKGPTIEYINIKKCVMLSVDTPKYNKIREETLQILNKYKLPPINIHFGYTSETSHRSKFHEFMFNKNIRNELTLGMLEIFENFVNENDNKNENENNWMLYLEDDVRPTNIDLNQDLTKLFNLPENSELIRPYIGKNDFCDLKKIHYNLSFGGGMNHGFYISVSGCKKVLNYTKKYKWKYICDIDLYKIAKHYDIFPTGYDGWSFNGMDKNNNIYEQLDENEKINMYQLSHIIFNQTSHPCV